MRNMRMWSLIAIAAVVGLSGAPSALAARETYAISVNASQEFTMPGVNAPYLVQSDGNAEITTYDALTVTVKCNSAADGVCNGVLKRDE